MTEILLGIGLCLVLILCAGMTASRAETDSVPGVAAGGNGIPTVSLTIDPEEYQEMIDSPDHSYRAESGSVRIDVPEGYRSAFGEIDPESTGVELPLGYIRGRGNSTWLEEKKSFRFKLEGKADLLGMGKSKNWLLISNTMDASLLRNRVMLEIGRRFGLRFTPRILSVDLYINGEYAGNYTLSQQVRIEKASVGIDEIPPEAFEGPDITGGYLLAMNHGSDESPENIFVTGRGVQFLLKEPEFASDADQAGTEEQRDFITGFLQRTEDAVFGEGGEDNTPWTEYMDMEAAAKYWWLQELCVNGDAFHSDSTFLFKERDGKLFWGPPWDFDIALNPVMYDDTLNYIAMPWLDHLRACDPHFQEALLRTWSELEPILEEMAGDGGVIDRFAEEINASWQQNHERWNPGTDPEGTEPDTLVIELKQFINQRKTDISACLDQLGDVNEQLAQATEKTESPERAEQTVPDAQPDDRASGISGTCYWRIDAQGHMEIGPLGGTDGTLDAWANAAQRPWHAYINSIRSVSFRGTVHAQTCLAMFYHCYFLEQIDLTGLDTSGVTVMRGMFAWCPSIRALDVSGLDTSATTSMREMFLACYGLTTLDVSAFDITGVTDLRCMFYRCRGLKNILLPEGSVAGAVNMSGMFADCSALESLDMSGLKAPGATSVRAMFCGCRKLSQPDLTGLDMSRVTSMGYMFAGCTSMTEADLKRFDTSLVTDMGCMFLGCTGLKILDLTGFDTAMANMEYMFANCTSLSRVTVGDRWIAGDGKGAETMFHGCEQSIEIIIDAGSGQKE